MLFLWVGESSAEALDRAGRKGRCEDIESKIHSETAVEDACLPSLIRG